MTAKEDPAKKEKEKDCAGECIKEERSRSSKQHQKLGTRQMEKEDYESDESFPASDPPANY